MARCGTCQREIVWASTEGSAREAFDTVPSIKGPNRFRLEFPEGGGMPFAEPMREDREFRGYTLHSTTCGQPYGGIG